MQLYKFDRLIRKYSADCKLITKAEGKWSAGEWQEGEAQTTDIKGAVVPITEQRIHDSGGTYKKGDCEFITLQTVEITSGTYLEYKGNKYKLEDSTDYGEYADFKVYVARGVSSFDTTETDTAGSN